MGARELLASAVWAYRGARIRMTQPAAPIEVVRTGPAESAGPAAFDGARAWGWLRRQVETGPRVPGTPGHAAIRDLLVEELGRWADAVAVQRWRQPIRRGPGAGTAPELANVLALFRADGDRGVPLERIRPDLMLCTHWDTRPVADHDPDPARRGDPVPGASDGASGTAVLLEAARALRAERPAASLVLAFWDGEDLGEHYYGSRLFAATAGRAENAPWRPEAAVLLDMIGGRGLRCTTEIHSLNLAGGLWNQVHATVTELGLDRHFHGPARTVTDDHVFLNRAGIPAVALVDYTYPHWHTTRDAVEACAPESLQVMGEVLLRFARTPVAG